VNPAWVQVAERRYMDGDRYVASFEVRAAYGVPKEVFVVAYSDDAYSHVATVDDVRRWPDSREAARDGDARFYRTASCARAFATRELLAGFIDHVQTRVRELADAWDTGVDLDLPGESVYVLGGES
jgi:hypothetical protein